MSTHLIPRHASREDLSILAEFNWQLIRDEGHRNPMSREELKERMGRLVFEGEYSCILFDTPERPDALAYALYSEGDEEIYLRQFFVTRDRRRQGLGRAAMNLLFSEIWPRNKRLRVDVLCHNEAAIAFWRACGFEDYCLTLERQAGPPLPSGE